jgi:hypothetical protein
MGLATGCLWAAAASAQTTRCDIPREVRDIWHCDHGFVIGPENVIIRLPIPETDAEALYQAGLEAARREEWRVAIAYFTAAHQRAHLVPRYMYNLGLAHARAGNHVPAIAWFVAYLIADPNAANRADIWREITAQEAQSRVQTDLLWSRAETAAAAIPDEPAVSDFPPNPRHRREAFLSLRQMASEVGNAERTRRFFTLAQNVIPQSPLDASWSVAHPSQTLIGGYGRSAWTGPSTVSTLRALARRWPDDWVTRHAQELAARPTSDDSPQLGLVFSDRGAEALQRLDSIPSFAVIDSETLAAITGEAFLVRGDRQNAAVALRRATEFARACEGYHSPILRGSGNDAAHLQALIEADSGNVEGAVARLSAYYARQISSANWLRPACLRYELPELSSPQERWSEARFFAAQRIAAFLLLRERFDEARRVAASLDSMRQEVFLEAYLDSIPVAQNGAALRAELEAVAVRAGGAQPSSPDQRGPIESAVAHARLVHGANLQWWLARIGAEPDPRRQVQMFGRAANTLESEILRTRSLYEHTGQVWEARGDGR